MKTAPISVLQNFNVLFADDDLLQRESLTAVLQNYFHEVYTASNGVDALAKYEKNQIDLIIIDVQMPEMNGLDVVKTIRKKDRSTPIIVMSAHRHEAYLMEAIKLSLVDYLVKPITMTKLTCVLQSVAQTFFETGLFRQQIETNLEYDFINKCIWKETSQRIDLTKNEVIFLEFMIKRRGHLVDCRSIEHAIYGSEGSTQAVRNLLNRLRKKIDSKLVKNIKELGYVLS
ncbi:MAG: response regulator transcription factor [Gammaproteobacteria bacterium]|nr:response regulator transcription factor [Gammaproteobacteria bacterium]